MLGLESAVGFGCALAYLCLGYRDAGPDIWVAQRGVGLECAGFWRLGNPYKTRLPQLQHLRS